MTSTARTSARSSRPTPGSGCRRRPATPAATTSNALFVAGIRRNAANPGAVIGSDITITGRVETKFGQVGIVPAGVGNTGSPTAQEVDLTQRRHDQLAQQPASCSRHARPRRHPRARTPSPARTTARCRGCACSLPEAIATGGGTTKFHDVFVEPGHHGRAPVPQEQRRGRGHAVVGQAGGDRHRARRRRRQPGRPAPAVAQQARRSTSTSSTSFAKVVGPLSFGFDFYKVMPQPTGAPAPTIQRGPINAAAPPTAPAQPAESAPRGELQRRELLPDREGERRPRGHGA